MRPEHLSPESDNSYYRDNLIALIEALRLLKAPVDTGDWLGEFERMLNDAGADSTRANVKPTRMALGIYRAARDANVLEVMSLIDPDKNL
jgi:hypothetical protein